VNDSSVEDFLTVSFTIMKTEYWEILPRHLHLDVNTLAIRFSFEHMIETRETFGIDETEIPFI